jgi:type II secretory pathway component GspD/PulD (secretin)
LRYLDPKAAADAAKIIYGGLLSVAPIKGGNIIVFAGSQATVEGFSSLLLDIDRPARVDADLLTVQVNHIPVREAIATLSGLSIFRRGGGGGGEKEGSGGSVQGGYHPDYWNSAVLIYGTAHQQDIARIVLASIDRPRKGRIDEVVALTVLEVDQVLPVLQQLFESLQFRPLSSHRFLVSGQGDLVHQAVAMSRKIDGSDLQVKVEAVFASLTDREYSELGANLASSRTQAAFSLNSDFARVFPTLYSGALVQYFRDSLRLQYAASEGNSVGEIIASPVLTVLNGQTAKLLIGQNVPFLDAKRSDKDGAESYSVQREDVGLSFEIVPVIRPSGDFISLKVRQEQSSVDPDSQHRNAVDLILEKKSLMTTVLAGDGDIIFLGGLRYEETSQSYDRVPLLGEIPLLGKLFTYQSEAKVNRNLILALRATVSPMPHHFLGSGVTHAPRGEGSAPMLE